MGSVLSSRALQQLLLRERGILHAWLVQIRDKAQTLLLRPVFHFQVVKSKTLCKITHPTQTCLCLHVSVSCFYSSVIFNPRVVFWPRIIRIILFQSGERSKQIKYNCLLQFIRPRLVRKSLALRFYKEIL